MRLTRIWFDSPRVRWRVIFAVVAAATVGVALWISHERELWTAEQVVAAAASAPEVAVARVVRRDAQPVRLVASAPVASAPARSVAAAKADDGCGLARLARGEEPGGAVERRHRELRQRWLTAMQSSADERVRAAGWLIGLDDSPEALRDRLATLAATSRDPLVQAYALRACRSDAAASSACQALSPQNWARLDRDNAAAWLAVAADPRVETEEQLDALQQAARGGRVDNHAATLHALVQAAQPPGIDDLDRLTMARELAGARGDWLGTEALRRHCSSAALRDAARVPACEAIAELMVTRAQSLPDLLMAREVGQRLGWTAERLDGLRDETDALTALERQFDGQESTTCPALARQVAFYADVGRLGEVGALRQALQRAPR